MWEISHVLRRGVSNYLVFERLVNNMVHICVDRDFRQSVARQIHVRPNYINTGSMSVRNQIREFIKAPIVSYLIVLNYKLINDVSQSIADRRLFYGCRCILGMSSVDQTEMSTNIQRW